ncbi:DUF4351 domain-containing protein [Acaryochloris sp. IP29b_bin.148]|nr:DUF4351 domain-containing protein [Acaryochloris sp. IP29b_bin.148]
MLQYDILRLLWSLQKLPRQLEALGETLLDFMKPADLVDWLQEHRAD